MQQNPKEYLQHMIKQMSITLSSDFSNFATLLMSIVHVVGAMVPNGFIKISDRSRLYEYRKWYKSRFSDNTVLAKPKDIKTGNNFFMIPAESKALKFSHWLSEIAWDGTYWSHQFRLSKQWVSHFEHMPSLCSLTSYQQNGVWGCWVS